MWQLLCGKCFASCCTRLFSTASSETLKKTSLYDLHVLYGGKMVPFAGFSMPVQYLGFSISDSHNHTRNHASIFDVSHMLQTKIHGKDRIQFMESLTTADISGLKEGHGTLSVFTNDKGGIEDDLIITKTDDNYLYLVTNAGCIDKDLAHLQNTVKTFQSKGHDVAIEPLHGQGLLALQGPKMKLVLQPGLDFSLDTLPFMTSRTATIFGIRDCRITRCGYTGEDGVEISVDPKRAAELCEKLLKSNEASVKLAGLGVRDTLRLEAGLCLYGNDIDETTTPVEATLAWLIAKRRRETKSFPGAEIILRQLKEKPSRKRVGILLDKGRPARQHYKIQVEGRVIGEVTSGGPSPTLSRNIAMAYVETGHSSLGTKLAISFSNNDSVNGEVVKMPFVPTNYFTVKNN